VGLVIGATYPEVLKRVRRIVPRMWFLLPGIGAQGGDLEASLRAGLTREGTGVLVNVSRGISQAADPGKAALEFRDRINEAREKTVASRGPEAKENTEEEGRALVEEIALGLHDIGAVRFGEFTLKSGLKSSIYVDLRLLVSAPKLMALAAKGIARLISGLSFERIAAIPYGGLPIGEAVSLQTGKPLIYPRREVKEHGTRNAIEGTFNRGETVLVLDDLITTGGSKIEALEPLQKAGLKIRDVAVLIDRGQGGGPELARRGYSLHALFTLGGLIDILARAGRIKEATRDEVREALGIQ
jgi:uridine monophosphate synthetase